MVLRSWAGMAFTMDQLERSGPRAYQPKACRRMGRSKLKNRVTGDEEKTYEASETLTEDRAARHKCFRS
jgi:hypothetical protein